MELRKLSFSSDEVQAAVVGQLLRQAAPFPRANIVEMVLDRAPERMVRLRFSDDDPPDPPDMELTREAVAAALIRYCHDHRVPLPRFGRKVVAVQNGGLVLMVNVHWVRQPEAA